MEADAGAVASLVCDVDGNPTPDIVWIHDPTNRVSFPAVQSSSSPQKVNLGQFPRQIVSNSPNLTMAVSAETVGKYYCKASVMGFPEVGAEATIYLKRAPAIASARRQSGIVGDTVHLHCVAFSVPKVRRRSL